MLDSETRFSNQSFSNQSFSYLKKRIKITSSFSIQFIERKTSNGCSNTILAIILFYFVFLDYVLYREKHVNVAHL